MWSGPRSLSTALLRSWESRKDTTTADEPFYGYFLAATGAERPGREDSLSLMPHDWESVLQWLEGPIPDGKAIWYQKHHALHLVGDLPWEWIDQQTNCFLIRDLTAPFGGIGTEPQTPCPPFFTLSARRAAASG